MAQNIKVINKAKSHIGEDGKPTWNAYGQLYGQAWCCMFVWRCFKEAGLSKLFYNGSKTASAPAARNWCKSNLAMIPSFISFPSDIVFFDWENNGTPNHIGFIEEKGVVNKPVTIEGNTGSPARVREREDRAVARGNIQDIWRPLFEPPEADKKEALKEDGNFEWQSIYALQRALGLKATGKLDRSTVKYLQKKVGVTADAQWGTNTSKAIQKMIGVTADGEFGKKSVIAFQKWINKQLSPDENTTNSKENATNSTKKLCIDTSYWQGKHSVADWKKVAKKCGFVIHRASYTSQDRFSLHDDSTFDTNFKNAKAAGLKCGAYHYSQAITVSEAKKEAEYLCKRLKGLDVDFYVCCDYEFGGRLNSKIGTKASEIANAFCDVVKSYGYAPLIYGNLTMMNSYLKSPKYPVWLAQYNDKCTYKKDYVMWQYTSSGSVEGISGRVDLSKVYETPDISPEPEPEPDGKKYTGKMPDFVLHSGYIISDLVKKCAWPKGTPVKKYSYIGGKAYGIFTEVLKRVYPDRSHWGKRPRAGSSCDVFAGTIVRGSGMDSKYPRGLDGQMKYYTDNLKVLDSLKLADFRPGDVVRFLRKGGGGHTLVLTELNGVLYKAEASYGSKGEQYSRYGHISGKATGYKKSNYKKIEVIRCDHAIRSWIQEGDTGAEVVKVQKFLKWYGFNLKAGGECGPITVKYIKAFQEAEGLTVDGEWGKECNAKAKEVVK